MGPVLSKSADYAIGPEDVTLHVSTPQAVTITLPANPDDGRVLRIRKVTANANTLTVDGNGNLIDGVLSSWGTGATVDLVDFYLHFVSGSGWWSR